MCVNTNKLFKQFVTNTNLLNVISLNLESYKNFQKSRLIKKNILIMNDIAEEGLHLNRGL